MHTECRNNTPSASSLPLTPSLPPLRSIFSLAILGFAVQDRLIIKFTKYAKLLAQNNNNSNKKAGRHAGRQKFSIINKYEQIIERPNNNENIIIIDLLF